MLKPNYVDEYTEITHLDINTNLLRSTGQNGFAY